MRATLPWLPIGMMIVLLSSLRHGHASAYQPRIIGTVKADTCHGYALSLSSTGHQFYHL